MVIRHAAGADDLRRLWDECFPVERDWAALYMRERYSPERVLVVEENGELAGMVHFNPSSLDYHGSSVAVMHMFGLGISPDLRGRGYARELVRHLCGLAAEKGIPMLAVSPYSDDLRGFYRRLGFGDAFSVSRENYGRDELGELSETVGPVTPDGAFKANTMYEKVLRHRCHLHRSAADWRFLTLAAEITGGRMLCVRRDGELCGYAVYMKRDGEVTVREVFAEDEVEYNALRAGVLEDAGVDSAKIESPACAHSAKKGAMLRPVDASALFALAAGYRPLEGEMTVELEDPLLPECSGRYTVRASDVSKGDRSGSVFITPGQLVETVMSAGPAPYANLLFC